MTKVKAYQCDECSAVMSEAERTRQIIRYEGPLVSGQVERDLCKACAPEPGTIDLQPLRRRRFLDTPVSGSETSQDSSPTTST